MLNTIGHWTYIWLGHGPISFHEDPQPDCGHGPLVHGAVETQGQAEGLLLRFFIKKLFYMDHLSHINY